MLKGKRERWEKARDLHARKRQWKSFMIKRWEHEWCHGATEAPWPLRWHYCLVLLQTHVLGLNGIWSRISQKAFSFIQHFHPYLLAQAWAWDSNSSLVMLNSRHRSGTVSSGLWSRIYFHQHLDGCFVTPIVIEVTGMTPLSEINATL